MCHLRLVGTMLIYTVSVEVLQIVAYIQWYNVGGCTIFFFQIRSLHILSLICHLRSLLVCYMRDMQIFPLHSNADAGFKIRFFPISAAALLFLEAALCGQRTWQKCKMAFHLFNCMWKARCYLMKANENEKHYSPCRVCARRMSEQLSSCPHCRSRFLLS